MVSLPDRIVTYQKNMYQKVDKSNSALIKAGMVIIKYPIADDPVEKFNEADTKKMWEYRVDSTKNGIITATPEKVYSADFDYDAAPLKTTIDKLIEDGRWWLNY